MAGSELSAGRPPLPLLSLFPLPPISPLCKPHPRDLEQDHLCCSPAPRAPERGQVWTFIADITGVEPAVPQWVPVAMWLP